MQLRNCFDVQKISNGSRKDVPWRYATKLFTRFDRFWTLIVYHHLNRPAMEALNFIEIDEKL